MSTITFELPEDVITLLGSPEAAAAEAREALVLSLLRDARISQGKAAQLLGLALPELYQLAARHQISSGPETPDEVRQEFAAMSAYLQQQAGHGGR